MTKLQQFYVEYVMTSPVFFAGQQVNGRVVVVLSDRMQCRGVRLEIRGRAYCHWQKHQTRQTGIHRGQRKLVHFYGEQGYLYQDVMLFGNGQDTGYIEAGSHAFDFSFYLPPTCATSFEGSAYGHIRYFCKAVIDKPWKFDHRVKAPFTVVRPIDLNYDPKAREPTEFQRTKTLGTTCCKAGHLVAKVKMPRRGFVPGEKLDVQIHVDNDSSRHVSSVAVKLEQKVTFNATRHTGTAHAGQNALGAILVPTDDTSGVGFHNPDIPKRHDYIRHTTNTVASIAFPDGVAPGESKSYDSSHMFVIPAIPPMLVDCQVVQMEYVVHVEVDPTWTSTDLDLRMPVIIGTVPLLGAVSTAAAPAGPHVAPSAPPAIGFSVGDGGGGGAQEPPPFAGRYEDLPPPSYEESAFGRSDMRDEEDNEYTRGDMQWAPRYPVYGGLGGATAPAGPPGVPGGVAFSAGPLPMKS